MLDFYSSRSAERYHCIFAGNVKLLKLKLFYSNYYESSFFM